MHLCYSCRLQVGKGVTMLIVIIELVANMFFVIVSGLGLGNLSELDKRSYKDEDIGRPYGSKVVEEDKSEELKAQVTLTFVPLCVIASIGVLSSIMLLGGMFHVKVSIRIIQIWLMIRTLRFLGNIMVTMQAFISQYVRNEYAGGYTLFILLELITIFVVWAFGEEAKQANHTIISPIQSSIQGVSCQK